MTYARLLHDGEQRLSAAGIDDAKTDAWYLLSFAAGMTRAEYLLYCRDEIPQDQEAAYLQLIVKRCAHIPLQHLTGEQEFMGYPFAVSGSVLIPRQDTECLVEETLAKAQAKKKAAILDVGTGSGCIAVSLKKLLPHAEITAVDLSGKALSVAKQNADRLGADVRFLQGDLFVPVAERFDMIVSNPPYIESGTIETLMPEVRLHEPRMALDGGADGLDFYRRLVKESPQYLKPYGWLLVEIGCAQREAVSALFEAYGFGNVMCKKDLAGLDRVVCGQLIEGFGGRHV